MNVLSVLRVQKYRIMAYKISFFINLVFFSVLTFLEYQIYVSLGNDLNLGRLLVYIMISISMFSVLAITRVPDYIVSMKKGEIIKYLVKPIELIKIVTVEEVGNCIYYFFQISPIVFLSIVFSGKGFYNIILFIFSLILSIILSSLISVVLYSFSMILMKESSMKAIISIIVSFFSGALVPFDILPSVIKSIAYFTPFAVLIDGPINVLYGDNIFLVVFLQLLWISVVYFFGTNIIEKNKKKVIVFGG